MAKFEIFTGKNKQYYFRLKADNGEIVLVSEAYKEKAGARNGIDSVKANAGNNAMFQLYESLMNGQYYFTLKAPNNEVIGVSEMYVGIPNAVGGMTAVSRAAAKAHEVADLSE